MAGKESATVPAIDKTTWGPGEWQNEVDRVDWIAHGFACFALRHNTLGHWCGYVGVPRDHPAYGKDYDDVDVTFHGGLTYANLCRDFICHVPAPGMPDDVWWLGGDFAHSGDVSPGTLAALRRCGVPEYERAEVYRALPYVRTEVNELAAQLAAQWVKLGG